MAFAPETVMFGIGDGSILGQFTEVEYGNVFEYSEAFEFPFGKEYNSYVYVGPGMKPERRYAKVLKTRAYVVVGEYANGAPMIEKWVIRNHKVYRKTYDNDLR